MSIRISLTHYSEMSDNSKLCSANATDNQVGADTNKKIAKRAEKTGVKNSSARFDDIAEKLSQMDLYSENNASPQANNQVKETGKSIIEELSAKQKIFVAAKKVIYGIKQNF